MPGSNVPRSGGKVLSNQMKQKAGHDHNISVCSFKGGDAVYVRSFNNFNHCIPGRIEVVTDPLSYKTLMSDGSLIGRHADHIKIRSLLRRQKCVTSKRHLAKFTTKLPSPDTTSS